MFVASRPPQPMSASSSHTRAIPAPAPVTALAALVAALIACGPLPAAGARMPARRPVRTLASGWQDAGGHSAEWDGRDDGGALLPSGAYFPPLEAGGATVSRTLVGTR